MGNLDKFDNYKKLSQKDWDILSVNQKNTYLNNHLRYPKRKLLNHLKIDLIKVQSDYRKYRRGEISNQYEDLTIKTSRSRSHAKILDEAEEEYCSDEEDFTSLHLQLKEANSKIEVLEHKLSKKNTLKYRALKEENDNLNRKMETMKNENDELIRRINSVTNTLNNMNKYFNKNIGIITDILNDR